MGKSELIKTIKRLLQSEDELEFLLKLKQNELEVLVACIRDRVDNNNRDEK